MANVTAGLTGGFALSASGSRTAIIDAMRAHSQVAGLVAAASVVFVVLAVPGLIALIPRAALGGVVVFAALRLIDIGAIRRLTRFRSTELGLALDRLRGCARVRRAGRHPGRGWRCPWWSCSRAWHDRPRRCWGGCRGWPACTTSRTTRTQRPIPGLVVFRYDAPLCFANAQDFRAQGLRAVDAQTEPVAWFLLNAEAIVELDATAADALAQLVEDLAGAGSCLPWPA